MDPSRIPGYDPSRFGDMARWIIERAGFVPKNTHEWNDARAVAIAEQVRREQEVSRDIAEIEASSAKYEQLFPG